MKGFHMTCGLRACMITAPGGTCQKQNERMADGLGGIWQHCSVLVLPFPQPLHYREIPGLDDLLASGMIAWTQQAQWIISNHPQQT